MSELLLIIQCENTVAHKKRRLTSDGEGDFADQPKPFMESEEDDSDEELGIIRNSAGYLKQAMYFVTDMEAFRPPRKRPK